MTLAQLEKQYKRLEQKHLLQSEKHVKLLQRMSLSEDKMKWFRFTLDELRLKIYNLKEKK